MIEPRKIDQAVTAALREKAYLLLDSFAGDEVEAYADWLDGVDVSMLFGLWLRDIAREVLRDRAENARAWEALGVEDE